MSTNLTDGMEEDNTTNEITQQQTPLDGQTRDKHCSLELQF